MNFAEGINVSPETIHKWHYGKRNPSDIELVKKLYDELCEFVSEDLIDTYDGKLEYAYRFEAIPDGNPTTSEDYSKAMIRLNSIIEKYVKEDSDE